MNNNPPYKAVVFQLIDAQNFTQSQLEDAFNKSVKTFNHIVKTIKIIENVYKCPILVNQKPVKVVNNTLKLKQKNDVFSNNPTIICKSSFIFYFHKNNPLRQDIEELFYFSAKKFNNTYEYQILEGDFYNLNIKTQFENSWISQVTQQLTNTKQQTIQYKQEEMTM